MIENEIYSALFSNATIFLNCAIRFINSGLNIYRNKMLSIINLQMALELAIKANIVKSYGLIYILQNIEPGISDSELENRYAQNKLKVKEFEQLKNFLKREGIFDFDKAEYAYIERFQLYRNKLVHFNYKFSNEEDIQIENDIIHVLVYILGVLMSDEAASEDRTYMQDYIAMDEYKKLVENPQYLAAISDFIDYEEGDPYYCPICDKKLLTQSKKCLGCLLDFRDEHCFGYVKCQNCHENMVIYDRLNIRINHGKIRGLCLYCSTYTQVYECPVCGKAFNLDDSSSKCRPGYCEWEQ